MEEKNLFVNSFEIFQEKDAECNSIIQEAEKIKKDIQNIYKDIIIDASEYNHDFSINILDYDVKIDKFTDKEVGYNPLTPRLYTCIYNPSFYLYKYFFTKENPSTIKEREKIDLSNEFEPETKNVIKNYVYDSFIGNLISKEYFENLAKQNFLLNIIRKQHTNNEDFFNKYTKHDENNVNIIFIHSKLQDFNFKTDSTVYHLKNAILEIKNANSFLHGKDFVVVGHFKNYQNENTLIKQLSESENYRWDKLKDYYPNDYIFLNNAEYLDDKINTNDWVHSNLFPPSIIDFKNCCLKRIETEEDIFYYSKIKDDGIFYKTEIFLPKSMRKTEYFQMLVNLFNIHIKLKNVDNSEK
jgi:hypothetical protein